ncbi:MAG: hypothetical protein ACNA78_08095 [Balneolaceae bacterium]
MKHVLLRPLLLAFLLFVTFFLADGFSTVRAQSDDLPNPGRALLQSLVMPGWGHYYVDKNNWTRGKIHLGSDLIIIGAFFGIDARANNLQRQFRTFANNQAGVSIDGRSRSFVLAMGNFNSLEEYNDFQLRSRNWDRLFDDIPENRWQWESDEQRRQFRGLRESAERADNQLPALAGLLVLNRLISGISAAGRARDMQRQLPELTILPVMVDHQHTGITANLTIRF